MKGESSLVVKHCLYLFYFVLILLVLPGQLLQSVGLPRAALVEAYLIMVDVEEVLVPVEFTVLHFFECVLSLHLGVGLTLPVFLGRLGSGHIPCKFKCSFPGRLVLLTELWLIALLNAYIIDFL